MRKNQLNGQDGIGTADWDKDTKMISVSYDAKKLDENKIKQMIASVGYDTDSHRAKKSTYSSLPGCCQYQRPEKSNEINTDEQNKYTISEVEISK